MKLHFTTNALRQLSQILGYHNDIGNTKKGRRIARQILDRAEELETYPELGSKEENLKGLGEGHRSLLVGTLYKIIYLIAKPFIYITDIFDTRQDPNKMKP